MKNRFVIGVNNMTAAEVEEFRDFLREKQCGWWHWLKNFWLVIDVSEQLKTTDIRDALGHIASGKRCLVMKIEETSDWSGFGPAGTEGKLSMFRWLHESWKD